MTRTSFVDEPAIAGQSVFMSTGAGGRSVLDAGLDLVYLLTFRTPLSRLRGAGFCGIAALGFEGS